MIAFMPILLLILLVLGAVYGGIRVRPKMWQMNRKMTYVFFSAYVVILLLATIAISVMDKTSSAEYPQQLTMKEADQIDQSLRDKILSKDLSSIDPSLILESRTHPTGETLRLKNATYDSYDEPPSIYIERKSEHDDLIEETIYKPLFIADNLDFSDLMGYALPEWNRDEVVFHSPPEKEIVYTSYQDAYLLSQFTKTQAEKRGNFGGMSRQIIVHLLVPASTEIEADDSLMITYLED